MTKADKKKNLLIDREAGYFMIDFTEFMSKYKFKEEFYILTKDMEFFLNVVKLGFKWSIKPVENKKVKKYDKI